MLAITRSDDSARGRMEVTGGDGVGEKMGSQRVRQRGESARETLDGMELCAAINGGLKELHPGGKRRRARKKGHRRLTGGATR